MLLHQFDFRSVADHLPLLRFVKYSSQCPGGRVFTIEHIQAVHIQIDLAIRCPNGIHHRLIGWLGDSNIRGWFDRSPGAYEPECARSGLLCGDWQRSKDRSGCRAIFRSAGFRWAYNLLTARIDPTLWVLASTLTFGGG